ncbi:hypothetical protein OMO38_18640 [Chryseobacterium sp. 09-1422]|uniref:Lipoprotein n=1 Tax=Chryseobacterium kimseyorum TaxID=2984028 RepID=A0ABT3I3A5_9FLAO|nr:hypothetical protein [Chryseobacterium kimseyorum]MCW3170551.1 hypothetical protein [Chryseobacterium kimseyorum]
MKKLLLLTVFATVVLTSCSVEDNMITTSENMKSTEMINFRKAIKTLGDSGNRITEEEKQSNQLSDKRKEALVPASKDLILSTGITESELMSRTRGNSGSIIVWAYKIYMNKTEEIKKSLQSQN